eukprot:g19995.t1
MHACRMLTAHVWRTATPRRVLARSGVGLTRLQAVGSWGGGRGSATKPSSTSSALTANQVAEKVGAGRSSTARAADAAADAAAAAAGGSAGTAEDGPKKTAAPRQANRGVADRKKGTTLAAGGGDGSEQYVYTESLAFLSSPPEKVLKGVGPKRGEQLAKLGIHSVANLLWHLPTGMVDRRQVSRVAGLVEGEIATVLLKVVKISGGAVTRSGPHVRMSKVTRVGCVDLDGDEMDVVIFGGPWVKGEFELGETKVVSGRVTVDKFSGNLVMSSPDVVAPLADLDKVMVVQPTYPLTAGLALLSLRSAIALALDKLKEMPFPPEWIDAEVMRENGWPGLREALVAAHSPQEKDDLGLSGSARSRLAYDELLASQLALALRRRQNRGAERTMMIHESERDGEAGERVEMSASGGAELVDEGRRRLPFELTSSQDKALDEILTDMDGGGSCSSLRMFRLLQGDVGSGKTAVAFLAMLKAAGQGAQSCMLAPTEVLTVQHLQTLRSMAEGIKRPDGQGNLRVELLTGSVKGKARQVLLGDVKAGKVDVLVATHAVLTSASTAFRDLGLAVVDEEQRFGVEQRNRLTGFAQHVLYLSATPIPRSLTLALYGDMEVSQIREMPQGAAKIETTLIPVAKAKDIVNRLKDREDTDDKVFWVLPQINKSESSSRQHLASATERYKALVEELGEDRVSLLHGKMTSAEKNKTLSDFSAAEKGKGLRVLVSTSIIEVGVDVPRAGVCVVENAEMFGLSQLHQLRGRLGRTNRGKAREASTAAPSFEGMPQEKRQTSHCLLLYGPDISGDATERLKAIREHRDGFLLAERDLALRGPGEVLGVRQKGYIEGKFKVADLARQGSLADHANKRARHLVESWVVRGDGAEKPAEGQVGVEAEGAAVAARDSGGGREGEQRGHPESLGLLLALCGLEADAKALLSGFAAPASWPLSSALPSGAANDVVETAVASVEGPTEEDIWAEPGEKQAREGGGGGGGGGGGDAASKGALGAAAQVSAGKSAAFTATPAGGGTRTAAYSLLNYEEAATGEAAAMGEEAHDLPKAMEGEEQELQEPSAMPAVAYFDDEADFLEKSASELEEFMVDHDEDEEYLSGFSFAPPPGFGAAAPPSWAAVGVDGMSEADRFKQLQQQQRTRLAERQRVEIHETSRVADAPRPPSQQFAAPVGPAGQRPGAVPSEGTPTVGGTSPSRGGEGAEPGIIRRANLLEGGQTIVLIDVETTGLGAKNDRVIQLAGKVLGSQEPRHLYSAYVDPEGAYLSPIIQEMTGITPAVLAANKARSFRDVWQDFAGWLAGIRGEEKAGGRGDGGVVLVAHNANFDHKFLLAEQSRGGFDKFMMGQHMGVVAVIDSLAVLREQSIWRQNPTDLARPSRPRIFKLPALFEHLYGYEMPGAHNAMGDVHGLESVLSAPGISERWRAVASDHPTCQIPVPRSLADLQAATEAASAPRPKSKASTRRGSGSAGSRRSYYTSRRGGTWR